MNFAAIDGSLLAFRAAAAGEKRTIEVTHRASERKQLFAHRTEFKNFLKNINEERENPFLITDFEIEDIIESPELPVSIHVLKELLKKILSACEADDYLILLDDNEPTFRHDLATMQEYKGDRTGKIKPTNLQAVKDYMVMYLGASVVSTLEADDYLNFYQYKGWIKTRSGEEDKLISVTFDKDAFGCPGWLYDYRTDENKKPVMKEPIFIDGLGELYVAANDKDIKGTGRKFFYFQVLYGDNADTYKGNKLAGVPYGKKSAYKDLVDLETDQECMQVIVDKFKEWYGDEFKYTSWRGDEIEGSWLTLLTECWLLAYMRRSEDDIPDVPAILKRVGVEF